MEKKSSEISDLNKKLKDQAKEGAFSKNLILISNIFLGYEANSTKKPVKDYKAERQYLIETLE